MDDALDVEVIAGRASAISAFSRVIFTATMRGIK